MKQADKPKNLILHEARSRGWHFDVDLAQGGAGLKGGVARGDMHIIDYITGLVGTENAHIVVNKALHLNGALIASAEVDEHGNYTDKGKLQLIAGELITQNFHEYDSGHTLNAALNADMSYAQAASEKLAGEQVDLEGSYKDMERKTPATIGKGEIRILKEGNHELNRDLRKVQREAMKGENFRYGFFYDTAKSYLDIAAEFATNIGEALGITRHNAQDFTLGTGTEPEEEKTAGEERAIEEEQQELARLVQEAITNLEEAESLEEAHVEESEGELIAVDASGGQCELPELKPKWTFIDYTPIPMQGEVQETGEITKLKVAAGYARQVISNYQEFATKYPNLAQYGLSVANVAVQSALGSVAGFMNAVRAEATGYAIGSAAGDQIEAVVDNTIGATAYSFKLADASLSDEDARALAALGLLSLWGGSQGKELATSALKKHHIDKFKFEDSHDPTKFHFEGDKEGGNIWKEWKVERYDEIAEHNKFGKVYHDPKTDLWWSKDTAKHGGAHSESGPSTWKVFKETDKGLKWYKDADKYGQFIEGKHKGPIGREIAWKDLRVKK